MRRPRTTFLEMAVEFGPRPLDRILKEIAGNYIAPVTSRGATSSTGIKLSKCEERMRLTDEENEYLICLKRGLSSEQMVVELGMTVDEVIEFGEEFFTRVFERIRRSIN